MGLKSMYASQDEVPEALRDHYTEDKGKFVLAIDDFETHPKVRGVVTANNENKTKRDEYKTRVSELEGKLAELPEGFSAEKWHELVSASDPSKRDEAIQAAKTAYETKIANLTKAHTDALAAKDSDINEREGFISRSLIDGGLKDHLLNIGVNPDLLDGAVASLRPSIKVQRAQDGNRTAIADTALGEIGLADFVKEWAGAKGKAYLRPVTGPDPKGGGRTQTGNKTVTRAQWDAMSPADRMGKAKDGFQVVD